MAGVGENGELQALARLFALGEIDQQQYRKQRTVLIDKYCGIETVVHEAEQESPGLEDEESTLAFYSMLGAFGVLIFIFLVYLFTTTDLTLTFNAIHTLWQHGVGMLLG